MSKVLPNVRRFVDLYYWDAVKAQKASGVPYLVAMAQAALESGWGARVKGNNMYGIKDTDGVNGNEQLIATTEFHKTPTVKYPVIRKITQVAKNLYKYFVNDYFRKYATPAESFADYGRFLRTQPRYQKAFRYTDPRLFAKEIALAGYATDPDYYSKIDKIMRMIENALAEKVPTPVTG